MRKIFYIISFALVGLTKLQAQQEGIFNHYLVDPVLINPAYAGSSDKYQLFAHYHTQFDNFQGAPQSYAFSANGLLGDKLGLGAQIFSENISFFNHFMAQIDYAYHYSNAGMKAGIGFSTSFSKTRLISDVTKGYLYNPTDYTAQDALSGATYFDASVGANLLLADKFFVSLSSPNLIRARLGSSTGSSQPSSLFKQFILYTGYIYKKDQYTFEPSLQIRKLYESPFEADVSGKLGIMDGRFMAGFTYTPGPTGKWGLMIGTKQANFQFYYTYTSSTANISSYTATGHEITLGLELAKKDKKFQRKKSYRN